MFYNDEYNTKGEGDKQNKNTFSNLIWDINISQYFKADIKYFFR